MEAVAASGSIDEPVGALLRGKALTARLVDLRCVRGSWVPTSTSFPAHCAAKELTHRFIVFGNGSVQIAAARLWSGCSGCWWASPPCSLGARSSLWNGGSRRVAFGRLRQTSTVVHGPYHQVFGPGWVVRSAVRRPRAGRQGCVWQRASLPHSVRATTEHMVFPLRHQVVRRRRSRRPATRRLMLVAASQVAGGACGEVLVAVCRRGVSVASRRPSRSNPTKLWMTMQMAVGHCGALGSERAGEFAREAAELFAPDKSDVATHKHVKCLGLLLGDTDCNDPMNTDKKMWNATNSFNYEYSVTVVEFRLATINCSDCC